ncbi:MAG: DUF5683 domain-containing protein [Candidatus Marinimicrobia bacterium]|nr:hypothetical protein [bacterium]MCG2716870.1 DUF5683 domain-containing protein [Candidatus Neomarinimicrobiota bacterium]
MVTIKRLFIICVILNFFADSLYAQESEVTQKIIILAGKINTSFSSRVTSEAQKRIALTNFSNIGTVSEKKNIGTLVSEVLAGELMKYETFTLVERMQLKKVLDEQTLALSGLIDSETSVMIGNLLGARAIISGSVIEAGNFFIVNARMVDVETGEVILTESIEIPQADLIALSNKLIVTKKYALDAAYRSLILPGWGQFYNDTPKRGTFYIGASAISIGTAVIFKIAGDRDYEKYQKNTPESVKYFDTAADKYQYRDYALYAMAGCWAMNIFDAYITAKRQLKQNSNQTTDISKLRISATPLASGLQLNLIRSF